MDKYKRLTIDVVKIPKGFAKHPPNEKKLQKVRDYYLKYGDLDKPIVITNTNKLVDGYTRYLVAKEFGLISIPYIFEEESVRKFILGTFQGNNKRYIWRVPNNMNVVSGDQAVVVTRKPKHKKTVHDIVTVVGVFDTSSETMKELMKGSNHLPVLKIIKKK